MKHISSVLPREVLEKYIEMYENKKEWDEKGDYEHWTNVFGIWMTKILTNSTFGNEDGINLSLNKKNFLGKKTRALLAVLDIKEPKTLRELKQKFITYYNSNQHMGAPIGD